MVLNRLSRAVLITMGTLGLFIAGCESSPTVADNSPPEESGRIFSTVRVNSPARTDHNAFVCYIGEGVQSYEKEDVSLFHVLNAQFQEIGFFLENGATYKQITTRTGDQDQEFLGNFDMQKSIERLTETNGPFQVVRGL